MEAEASVIARRIRERIIIENRKPLYAHRLPKVEAVKREPARWKTLLAIGLMALSVVLTQTTLILVNAAKRLEH